MYRSLFSNLYTLCAPKNYHDRAKLKSLAIKWTCTGTSIEINFLNVMHELDIKSPTSDVAMTERGSLSMLREFLEKQEELLGIQESSFRAAADRIIQELKTADRGIYASQQEIDSLRTQMRTMLSEIRATIK